MVNDLYNLENYISWPKLFRGFFLHERVTMANDLYNLLNSISWPRPFYPLRKSCDVVSLGKWLAIRSSLGGRGGGRGGVLDNLRFCLRCLMEFLPSPPLSPCNGSWLMGRIPPQSSFPHLVRARPNKENKTIFLSSFPEPIVKKKFHE